MELGLENKVAIVTGASRGIGRAIAETLAAEGMRVVLAARSETLLAEVAAGLPSESLVVPVDLRDADAAAMLVASAAARFGRIDALVNNAGATKRGDFFELSEADWTDGFALKFFGAMRCCRAVWPHLRTSRGAIVNIAGIGGRTGSADFGIGGSVNAAVMNLTKVLADRGVADGVRVNAVNPGSTATDRLNARIASFALAADLTHDDAAHEMAHRLGIARFGQPAEVARVVAFLLSPAAGFSNGSIVDVDGGQTRTL